MALRVAVVAVAFPVRVFAGAGSRCAGQQVGGGAASAISWVAEYGVNTP